MKYYTLEDLFAQPTEIEHIMYAYNGDDRLNLSDIPYLQKNLIRAGNKYEGDKGLYQLLNDMGFIRYIHKDKEGRIIEYTCRSNEGYPIKVSRNELFEFLLKEYGLMFVSEPYAVYYCLNPRIAEKF